jgi:hypothetical protein
LFGLEAGQHVCLALPLSDQLRTGLALRVDGIEGTVGSAALRHLRDCPVNLGKPRVDIGERVRLSIDPVGRASHRNHKLDRFHPDRHSNHGKRFASDTGRRTLAN